MFTLKDADFANTVTAWWQVRERFRASCAIIVGEFYEPGGFLELKLITSVVAAESFHGALNEIPAISKEDALKRLDAARNVLSDEDWAWLSSFVPHGFSLRDRLLSLSRRLPVDVRKQLLPDEEKWARSTKKARNDLSHSAHTSISPHTLYAIVRITRAVIIMNILLELGISEERLVEALKYHRTMSRACELAHEYFPHQDDSAG
nr:HEPN domain-containing protein [Corynebacterium lactis]